MIHQIEQLWRVQHKKGNQERRRVQRRFSAPLSIS